MEGDKIMKDSSKVLLVVGVVLASLFSMLTYSVYKEGQRVWIHIGSETYEVRGVLTTDHPDTLEVVYNDRGMLKGLEFSSKISMATPIGTLYSLNDPEFNCQEDEYGRESCELVSDTLKVWLSRKEPCHWWSTVCNRKHVEFMSLEKEESRT